MKPVLVIQHVEHEGLGMIADVMAKRNIKPVFVKVSGNEPVPRTLYGYSALILMGGPMGVYETGLYPFINDEISLVKEGLKNNVPVLGICLGAQIIAKALGSDVYKGKKKEIGWYELRLTEDGKTDDLFKCLPSEFSVFQWHGDTFDIPDGCSRLAFSDLFSNQIIKAGKNVYGLQFHLEVTEEMIRDWCNVNDEELKSVSDYIDLKGILRDTPKLIKLLNAYGEVIFGSFFALVEKCADSE